MPLGARNSAEDSVCMLSNSRHTVEHSPQYPLEQLFQLNGDLSPVGAPKDRCISADLGAQGCLGPLADPGVKDNALLTYKMCAQERVSVTK